jgi:DNA-binding MarR family transcriptional regulator
VKGAADRQWPANWRAALRDHAKKLWRAAGKRPPLDKQAAELLDKALGPLADDALEIVEGYTLGARRAADQADPPAEFGSRLQIILNGVEASLGNRPWANQATGEAPPHVIQSELWQILRRVRESAELSYSREHDLIELDRRIVFLLQSAGPLVPADISGAVGVDKAQVSRSVKRLLKLGLAEREQIRAPLRLTKKGAGIAKRMLRRADLRNRELTIDISEDELNDFYETAEILLERSMALYEQERALAQGSGRGGDADGSPGRNGAKANEKIVIDRARIVSPLMTLSAYFSRSGALAFKRLTGLSNFEAFVLSEIGIAPPIEWAALVRALARDHSQAGRTVKALMDRGLVEREGGPGRRHGRFYPSPEGVRLHKVIHDAGRQRSDFLLAPLTIDRRARFLDIFAKLRRNAVAQLERERAFADFSRD